MKGTGTGDANNTPRRKDASTTSPKNWLSPWLSSSEGVADGTRQLLAPDVPSPWLNQYGKVGGITRNGQVAFDFIAPRSP